MIGSRDFLGMERKLRERDLEGCPLVSSNVSSNGDH